MRRAHGSRPQGAVPRSLGRLPAWLPTHPSPTLSCSAGHQCRTAALPVAVAALGAAGPRAGGGCSCGGSQPGIAACGGRSRRGAAGDWSSRRKWGCSSQCAAAAAAAADRGCAHKGLGAGSCHLRLPGAAAQHRCVAHGVRPTLMQPLSSARESTALAPGPHTPAPLSRCLPCSAPGRFPGHACHLPRSQQCVRCARRGRRQGGRQHGARRCARQRARRGAQQRAQRRARRRVHAAPSAVVCGVCGGPHGGGHAVVCGADGGGGALYLHRILPGKHRQVRGWAGSRRAQCRMLG